MELWDRLKRMRANVPDPDAADGSFLAVEMCCQVAWLALSYFAKSAS